MKKLSLLLCVSVLLLNSCRKDEELSAVEQGTVSYEGTFLVDYVYDYNYSGQNSDTERDMLLEITRNQDTLFCLNSSFIIETAGQSSFKIMAENGWQILESLTYTQDFNHINYFRYYPSQLSGPSSDVSCVGDRSSLFDPETVHPYESELVGQYELVFYQYDWADNVDTTYTEIVDISMTRYNSQWSQSYTLHIDTLDFSVGEFITYYNHSGGYQSNNETEDLFWTTDSFAYHYVHTDWLAPQTLQHQWDIVGVKQ